MPGRRSAGFVVSSARPFFFRHFHSLDPESPARGLDLEIVRCLKLVWILEGKTKSTVGLRSGYIGFHLSLKVGTSSQVEGLSGTAQGREGNARS